MDIEKLTKSQIVLLTLLVSFVTSIATGIVAVSLMDQAPPAITQTINRVVERTVERVVPSESQAAATVVTEEKTVIVKESDLIAQAVTRIAPSIVRVYRVAGEEETLVAIGTAISDTHVITDGTAIASGSYVGKSSSGAVVPLALVGGAGTSLGVFMIKPAEGSAGTWSAPGAALNTDPVRLGQTVVALTGAEQTRLAEGIVTNASSQPSQEAATSTDSESSSNTQSFDTNITGDQLLPGSTAINPDGAVIGIFMSSSGSFLSAQAIRGMLSVLEAPNESNVSAGDS